MVERGTRLRRYLIWWVIYFAIWSFWGVAVHLVLGGVGKPEPKFWQKTFFAAFFFATIMALDQVQNLARSLDARLKLWSRRCGESAQRDLNRRAQTITEGGR